VKKFVLLTAVGCLFLSGCMASGPSVDDEQPASINLDLEGQIDGFKQDQFEEEVQSWCGENSSSADCGSDEFLMENSEP